MKNGICELPSYTEGGMKTLERKEANKLWDKWWGEMRREWFKVEVLQDYYGEDSGPSLDSWLQGRKDESVKLMAKLGSNEWTKSCRQKIQDGAKLIRLHLVEKPYSPYIEWEIEIYKRKNIPLGGEQVYLVDKKDLSGHEIPSGDMMIFDDKRVVINTYDNNGLMTHETFYDETDDTSSFLKLKKELFKLAQPLE